MAQVTPTFPVTEIAVMAGVTPQTVRNWVTAGLPHQAGARRGGGQEVRISIKDLLAWQVGRALEKAGGGLADQTEELKRRRMAAEVTRAELELAKETGQVVEIAAVAEVVGQQLDRVRARLIAIPSKAAPLVAPETEVRACQATIQAEVDEALNELVGYAVGGSGEPGASDRPADRRAASATAPADGERVGRPRKKAERRGKRRTR